MNDLTSEILQKSIYDFMSHKQLETSLKVTLNKNVVFIPAMAQENIDLYYILKGTWGFIRRPTLDVVFSSINLDRTSLSASFPKCGSKIFIAKSRRTRKPRC